MHGDVTSTLEQVIRGIHDASAPADRGRHGRTGHTQLGNGPGPKMNSGPSTMLSALANQSTRIATAASPARGGRR